MKNINFFLSLKETVKVLIPETWDTAYWMISSARK